MQKECVVLIHGFARTSYSMRRIKSFLQNLGYNTVPIDYPSHKFSIEELSEKFVVPQIKSTIGKYQKIHFVAYSLGGVILRYILSNRESFFKNMLLENLGKVVFIASPNHGSEIVTHFSKYCWFKIIFGPAINQLSQNGEFLSSLKIDTDYECGVISGNSSGHFIFHFLISEDENDGTVSVQSTKIEGMKDHIVMPKSHIMLLYDNKVREEVAYFIKNGSFNHNS